MSDATRDALSGTARVPERFRRSVVHVVEDAVSDDLAVELGKWLHAHRGELARVGDDAGEFLYCFERRDFDDAAPPLFGPIRRLLADLATDPAVLDALVIEPFQLQTTEVCARLYHHGGRDYWHDEIEDGNGDFAPTRRIGFELFLHADPKLFSGGELEFFDGRTLEPKNRRLVLYHPAQTMRARPVECWSAEAINGRWSLAGFLHGPAPENWTERVRMLRGE